MSDQNKRRKSQVLYDILVSGVLLTGMGTSVYCMLDANQKMTEDAQGTAKYHKAYEEMVGGAALGVSNTGLTVVISLMSLLKIPRRLYAQKIGPHE